MASFEMISRWGISAAGPSTSSSLPHHVHGPLARILHNCILAACAHCLLKHGVDCSYHGYTSGLLKQFDDHYSMTQYQESQHCVCVCVCARARVRMRACVHACVCVRACVIHTV
jgi:hypothetical protein